MYSIHLNSNLKRALINNTAMDNWIGAWLTPTPRLVTDYLVHFAHKITNVYRSIVHHKPRNVKCWILKWMGINHHATRIQIVMLDNFVPKQANYWSQMPIQLNLQIQTSIKSILIVLINENWVNSVQMTLIARIVWHVLIANVFNMRV